MVVGAHEASHVELNRHTTLSKRWLRHGPELTLGDTLLPVQNPS